MTGPRLGSVVADTGALLSLAIPRTDETYDTASVPDPLQYLLTSCTVSVPPTVIAELRELTQSNDIQRVAATNVLAAQQSYSVEDPFELAETADSRPMFGLGEGETEAIVLANALGVDGFLTDEFDQTNFPVIHSVLQGPHSVPTPRLIFDYARNGHMSPAAAQRVISIIGSHRDWDESPYVAEIRHRIAK